MNTGSTKFCYACAAQIDSRAVVCPNCGVAQPGSSRESLVSEDPEFRRAIENKTAAGLCGILLGGFGIHKFLLGFTNPGLIMLLTTVLSCGIAAPIMWTIGLIEGIIYLTKSDEDFYQTYVVEKKGWF